MFLLHLFIIIVILCSFSRDQHGFTPLHYACMHGQTNIIDFLLNRGCRVDILNMGGDSLLHVAAAFGKYDVVQKVCVCVLNSVYLSYVCVMTPTQPG